ncbi:MAG: hypothetical protein HY553_10020 [Elusimicrobia bacterium]|nr:hypothetical protein [Elusimicrobiota bacterium]
MNALLLAMALSAAHADGPMAQALLEAGVTTESGGLAGAARRLRDDRTPSQAEGRTLAERLPAGHYRVLKAYLRRLGGEVLASRLDRAEISAGAAPALAAYWKRYLNAELEAFLAEERPDVRAARSRAEAALSGFPEFSARFSAEAGDSFLRAVLDKTPRDGGAERHPSIDGAALRAGPQEFLRGVVGRVGPLGAALLTKYMQPEQCPWGPGIFGRFSGERDHWVATLERIQGEAERYAALPTPEEKERRIEDVSSALRHRLACAGRSAVEGPDRSEEPSSLREALGWKGVLLVKIYLYQLDEGAEGGGLAGWHSAQQQQLDRSLRGEDRPRVLTEVGRRWNDFLKAQVEAFAADSQEPPEAQSAAARAVLAALQDALAGRFAAADETRGEAELRERVGLADSIRAPAALELGGARTRLMMSHWSAELAGAADRPEPRERVYRSADAYFRAVAAARAREWKDRQGPLSEEEVAAIRADPALASYYGRLEERGELAPDAIVRIRRSLVVGLSAYGRGEPVPAPPGAGAPDGGGEIPAELDADALRQRADGGTMFDGSAEGRAAELPVAPQPSAAGGADRDDLVAGPPETGSAPAVPDAIEPPSPQPENPGQEPGASGGSGGRGAALALGALGGALVGFGLMALLGPGAILAGAALGALALGLLA